MSEILKMCCTMTWIKIIIYYLCVFQNDNSLFYDCICMQALHDFTLSYAVSPTHEIYTWNIEIFLMWSKCWATKSNKSCMLAKGKQLKHGDVRMKRDSCLVLVCLCEGEWDRTWQKKQSLCACRFDVSASTNKDRVKHCSKQTRTLHTIGWVHKYFWSFSRIMRHTECCLFWVKQWKFKNNSHHLSFNTNLLFQTFSYW